MLPEDKQTDINRGPPFDHSDLISYHLTNSVNKHSRVNKLISMADKRLEQQRHVEGFWKPTKASA